MPADATTDPKPRLKRTEQLRVLWAQMDGYRARYGLAIGVMFVGLIFSLTAPLCLQFAIDQLLHQRPIEDGFTAGLYRTLYGWIEALTLGPQLLIVATLSVVLTFIGGLCQFIRGRAVAKASEGICQRLRRNLYDRLQHTDTAWHDQAEIGDTVQRCSSDVETVRGFLAGQVIEVVNAASSLIIAVPILFLLDWRLGLASTILMPIFIAWGGIAFRWIHSTFKAMDESEGALTARIQENLTNIRVVRAFGRQAHERGRFDALNQDFTKLYWKHYVVLCWYWSVSDLMVFSQLGLALFVGAYLVQLGPEQGGIAVGTLVAAWLLVGRVVWPVRMMGRTLSELGKAMVSIERVEEILALPAEAEPESPIAANEIPERFAGRVVFDAVRFVHPKPEPKPSDAEPSNLEKTLGDATTSSLTETSAATEPPRDAVPALNGVSFTVEPGQTLGILGASGSGKTTLVNLLLRFYDPQEGSIQMDDLPLERLPRATVREQIGVVMQEPFLYSKTIRDNLRFGRFDAQDDAVMDVARVAAVHGSIEGFDGGYDTLLGERGVTLSGGQRQRMAIARALLQEKPVLVLDDAFSAVDTRTESQIIDALRSRRGRCTTILIAHRISTLDHADQIIVLDHGRVVQRGTPESLREEDGLYKRLHQMQNDLESDLRAPVTATSTSASPSTSLPKTESKTP